MNNEIKEMPQIDATLEYSLEDFMEAYKIVDEDKVYSNGIEYVPIFRVKQWLDYNNITNLQEELDRCVKANVILDDENAELQDKITNLQEENEKTNIQANYFMNRNDDLEEIIDDYKSRNEKAIEYINHENFKRTILVGVGTKKYIRNILNNVLNILNGGDE